MVPAETLLGEVLLAYSLAEIYCVLMYTPIRNLIPNLTAMYIYLIVVFSLLPLLLFIQRHERLVFSKLALLPTFNPAV